MKLEVGMYVRFNGIIRQIEEIRDDYIVFDETFFDEWAEECHILNKKEFNHIKLKVSHNIINLIEAGDYVNELPVEDYYTRYDEEKDDYIKIGIITLEDYWKGTFTSVEDIKSIVTREQFSAMEYRLGDK